MIKRFVKFLLSILKAIPDKPKIEDAAPVWVSSKEEEQLLIETDANGLRIY